MDSVGRIHGLETGSATFPGCSGAVNPTLTLVALALRTGDSLLRQLA